VGEQVPGTDFKIVATMKRKAVDELSSCSSKAVSHKKELETWRQSVYSRAQSTLEKDFPPKIQQLHELYSTDQFASQWPAFSVDDYKVVGDTVPGRVLTDRVQAMSNTLKKECRLFLASMVDVKMWVQLNMPKIEDGGQFGVEVQEEMVEQVQVGEDLACTIAEEVSRFFGGRGKIVAKRVKYPNCDDYARCLWEMDIRRILLLRRRLRQLRNAYLMILDVFSKNSKFIITDRHRAHSSNLLM